MSNLVDFRERRSRRRKEQPRFYDWNSDFDIDKAWRDAYAMPFGVEKIQRLYELGYLGKTVNRFVVGGILSDYRRNGGRIHLSESSSEILTIAFDIEPDFSKWELNLADK